jgi:hypothetical protein
MEPRGVVAGLDRAQTCSDLSPPFIVILKSSRVEKRPLASNPCKIEATTPILDAGIPRTQEWLARGFAPHAAIRRWSARRVGPNGSATDTATPPPLNRISEGWRYNLASPFFFTRAPSRGLTMATLRSVRAAICRS